MKRFIFSPLLFSVFVAHCFCQTGIYLQTPDSTLPERSAYCLFEERDASGVTLSIGREKVVADQLPAEVKVWLHRSYLRTKRKDKLATVPAFDKVVTLEDGRSDDPKRFERVGDKVRLTFWGDGGKDGDVMEFETVRPIMALEGELRLVKYPEFVLRLQEREGKLELFMDSGPVGARIAAAVVSDTASEAVVSFGDKQLKLRKGNDLAHFVMEYEGASHDLFGFYGRPGKPSLVSQKSEIGAVALLEEAIGLTKYAPLRLQLMKASAVLGRGDNFPMVAGDAKTSTEVFNRILAKHPDLDASDVGGGKGPRLEAAQNPWAIVRITDRRKHPGVLMFSRNLKLPKLNREELMKSKEVPAVIYFQGYGPDERTRILLGSAGKARLVDNFMRCLEGCDLDILYP